MEETVEATPPGGSQAALPEWTVDEADVEARALRPTRAAAVEKGAVELESREASHPPV